MNSLTKWAIAAAAVVVVAIVGYSLFPSRGGTASQAAASPVVVAAASVAPSPVEVPATGGACVPRPVKFDPAAAIDLTGAWAGDDEGIYYVRQLDNVIWWNGMSQRDEAPGSLGRFWNNVGRGEIRDDLTIAAEWADVPRGQTPGYGTVNFRIGADASGNIQITKTSETGSGRGDTRWTRCEPGFPS
jgi:hypothetical protein